MVLDVVDELALGEYHLREFLEEVEALGHCLYYLGYTLYNLSMSRHFS